MSTFINPFVDRGFKIIFGREDSKELLIDLLNDLFEGEHIITELSFMNVEMPGDCPDGRAAVFDLKCKDQDGSFFIVEVQNAQQTYFYERGLYYLCRMLCDQDKKGDMWHFSLCPVYGIFFLNFKSGKTEKIRTDIVLSNRETGRQVSGLMRQIYIEMPFFNKKEADCKNGLDYWLYTLKYMENLQELPFKGQKALFKRLEELAKIVNLNKKERLEYEECLKVYRDNQNTWDFAIEKGYNDGVEKGIAEGLKKGLKKGIKKGITEGLAKGMAEGLAKGMEKGMEKGMTEGIAEGMEKGIEKGRTEERAKSEAILRKAASAMKKAGIDIQSIIENTGLDAETIAAL